jgi:hypothetical protein
MTNDLIGGSSTKKGDGCFNLYLLRTSDEFGIESKRSNRCCYKRYGITLKSWRCVGKDSQECPGFESWPSKRKEAQ